MAQEDGRRPTCLFRIQVNVSPPFFHPPLPLSHHPHSPFSHLLVQSQSLSPSSSQLVEKRLLALKGEEGVQPPPSHHAPLLDSGPSESVAGQDAQRCYHSLQLGVSDKSCPPETNFKDHQRHSQADAHLSRPKAFAVSSGRQEYLPLQAPHSPPQGHGHTYSGLGPRDAYIPREASPVRETHRPVDRSRENEEDLPSLAFLWASPESLLPSGLSLSPVPASGLACPGGWGPQGSAQSQFFQTLGLSQVAPAASKSGNALGGGPAHAEKTPILGSDLSVSGKPFLALEMVHSSQPQKRKCDQSVTERSSKRHYSEWGVPPTSSCLPQEPWAPPHLKFNPDYSTNMGIREGGQDH